MPELGSTGSWLCLPVTLCVGLVGAFLIFQQIPLLNKFLTGSDDTWWVKPNGVASVIVGTPPINILRTFEEALDIDAMPWMQTLVTIATAIKALVGFWSVLALICPFAFMAKTLYYGGVASVLVWVITHIGIFYCYRRRALLEFISGWRTKEDPVLIFGDLGWPASFWYNLCFKSVWDLMSTYYVIDLYYSWYLILKVGGSGWEFTQARDLPGWDEYEKRRRERMRAKYAGFDDDEDEESGDAEHGHGGGGQREISPEELELLKYLMAQQMKDGQGEIDEDTLKQAFEIASQRTPGLTIGAGENEEHQQLL